MARGQLSRLLHTATLCHLLIRPIWMLLVLLISLLANWLSLTTVNRLKPVSNTRIVGSDIINIHLNITIIRMLSIVHHEFLNWWNHAFINSVVQWMLSIVCTTLQLTTILLDY